MVSDDFSDSSFFPPSFSSPLTFDATNFMKSMGRPEFLEFSRFPSSSNLRFCPKLFWISSKQMKQKMFLIILLARSDLTILKYDMLYHSLSINYTITKYVVNFSILMQVQGGYQTIFHENFVKWLSYIVFQEIIFTTFLRLL